MIRYGHVIEYNHVIGHKEGHLIGYGHVIVYQEGHLIVYGHVMKNYLDRANIITNQYW